MFVDASAIVAILTREDGADYLADCLDRAATRMTSAIAVFEAVAAICRKRRTGVADGKAAVLAFLELAAITITPINAAELDAALDAFDRYGKGRGHPAQQPRRLLRLRIRALSGNEPAVHGPGLRTHGHHAGECVTSVSRGQRE